MKYWDIKPSCSNVQHHRQIKRFMRSLKSRGGIVSGYAVLIVYNKYDPCKSYITKEKLDVNTIMSAPLSDRVKNHLLRAATIVNPQIVLGAGALPQVVTRPPAPAVRKPKVY